MDISDSGLYYKFITKLPLVSEKDAILVVCNRLSKMTHFMATTEGTSAEGLVRLFRDNIWKLHGLPESIVSDRGPQFAVELMKKLNRILEIEIKLLTAFHSQTDGQTCYMQVHLFRNYIPTVISSPNYTSPPSMAATCLTTCFIVVLQLSRYSVFHGRDTLIQLSLP